MIAVRLRLQLALGLMLVGVSVALGVARAQAQQEAPVPNKAQRLVFMDDHLRDVDKGSVLNYDFSSQTKDEQKLTDTVRVTVADVLDAMQRSSSRGGWTDVP